MSLPLAKAKLSQLRGCPPEDPRDKIGVLEEIPATTQHAPPLGHTTVGSIMCVFIWNVWILFTVQKMLIGNIPLGFEVGSIILASTRPPMGIHDKRHIHSSSQLHSSVSVMSLIELITWLNVQYTVCSSAFLRLNGVTENCPCEKIICPSRGRFLVLVHAQMSDKHTTHKKTYTQSSSLPPGPCRVK